MSNQIIPEHLPPWFCMYIHVACWNSHDACLTFHNTFYLLKRNVNSEVCHYITLWIWMNDHSAKNSCFNCHLLGCDATKSRRHLRTFQWSVLPPSLSWRQRMHVPQSNGKYLLDYMAWHPRRWEIFRVTTVRISNPTSSPLPYIFNGFDALQIC